MKSCFGSLFYVVLLVKFALQKYTYFLNFFLLTLMYVLHFVFFSGEVAVGVMGVDFTMPYFYYLLTEDIPDCDMYE